MAANNLDAAWADLMAWQSAIHGKDEQLKQKKSVCNDALPPIRTKAKLVIDKTTQPIDYFCKRKRERSSTPVEEGKQLQEKAQEEKDKGNGAFQKQRYSEAAMHYTRALELSTSEGKEHRPVYFTNRAMAYLKLSKYAEAADDCTRALELQPMNIKALWRRGMARRELGRLEEARQDFEKGLAIEPGSKIFVDELSKLPIRPASKSGVSKSETKATAEPKAAAKPAQKERAKVERRRLPITIVDEAYSAGPKVVAKTTAKKIIEPVTETKSGKIEPAAALPPMKLVCPRTNLEFERDWKACRHRGTDVLYEYFQMIPPAAYATLFRSSLESEQFEQMLDLLESHYTRYKTDKEIYSVLVGLSQVRRIDMLVMFLGRRHTEGLQRLFARVGGAVEDRDALERVARTYGINKL
ncbi:hypothetical protein BJV82DRAFT_672047 [Fennellomyces sp. T-0311]|nr:hypothetical protein BJV82DRAFT_672047 [Fennellomyces sp. T-0311]